MPDLSIEHLERLEAQTSKDFVQELINMFVLEVPKQVGQLNASFDRRNWKEVERHAHTLKSSFGNLGLMQTRNYCEIMEALAHDCNIEDLSIAVDKFDDIHKAAIEEIVVYCKTREFSVKTWVSV